MNIQEKYVDRKIKVSDKGIIDRLLPKGFIATPFALIEEIVDKLPIKLDNQSLKVVDIACGRGAFLLVLKQRFMETGIPEKIVVENMLYGVDIDPKCVAFTKAVINPKNKYKDNIVCANALEWGEKNKMKFDVVVGNPPYSINNSGDGRTSGTKTRLYATFYKELFEKAPTYAVILPSNWIGRQNDSVRKSIMNDHSVEWIVDTTHWFADKIKGTPTCAVIRNKNYNNVEKKIQVRDTVRVATADTIVSLDASPSANLVAKLVDSSDTMADMWCRNVNTGITRSCDTLTDNVTPYPVVLVTGAVNAPPTMGYVTTPNPKQKHFNSIKVVMNTNASPSAIGAIKIVSSPAYTTDSIVFFPVSSLSHANNLKSYLESCIVRFIVATSRNSHGNSKSFFSLIPKVDFTRSWTDKELYKYFKLTNEEIKLIEDTVK